MHELSVVFEIVKMVEEIVEQNGLNKVDKIILQIGELSSMIPKYVEACYPAAVDRTPFEETRLEIEILPGNGLCRECGKVYRLIENKGVCPHCESKEHEVISGREFFIKEIIAC
ncbi:MAG: hydrogenase maturation nickel metallochaperone HypA [Spirochaetales bacterium]|nr:hydrogenase maturation nickel metallochaperone HypA [Spirochaetales bacterium]